jgi:hypothetical protein
VELAVIVTLALLCGASLTALQTSWRAQRRLERRLAEAAPMWPVAVPAGYPPAVQQTGQYPAVQYPPVQYPAVRPVRTYYWPHEVRYRPPRQ